MLKHFCDRCGDEITLTNKLTESLSCEWTQGNASASIEVAVRAPDAIELCKYCVLELVGRMDDRPKEDVGKARK